jgi:hypothetical protein
MPTKISPINVKAHTHTVMIMASGQSITDETYQSRKNSMRKTVTLMAIWSDSFRSFVQFSLVLGNLKATATRQT